MNQDYSVTTDGSTAFSIGDAFAFSAAGLATSVSGAGSAIDGVMLEGCGATDTVDLKAVVLGRVTGKAGAAITAATASHALMINASNKFVPYVSGAGNVHVANWLPHPGQLTAAADDEIEIVLVGSPLDR